MRWLYSVFYSGFEAWRRRFSVMEMMALSGGKEGVWVDR